MESLGERLEGDRGVEIRRRDDADAVEPFEAQKVAIIGEDVRDVELPRDLRRGGFGALAKGRDFDAARAVREDVIAAEAAADHAHAKFSLAAHRWSLACGIGPRICASAAATYPPSIERPCRSKASGRPAQGIEGLRWCTP